MAGGRISVGKPAPPFSLTDQNGRSVALADLAGRWTVLYFYPKDDTPNCTIQACDFTDALQAFQGLDAVVVGCSPDSPESHRKFIAKHQLRIRLLSDPDHAVINSYGAWGKKAMSGRTVIGVLRSTVLIDPAGKVAYHWPSVTAAGHAEEVREKLAELRRG
jgi:peroxiredoxin Q/BCP